VLGINTWSFNAVQLMDYCSWSSACILWYFLGVFIRSNSFIRDSCDEAGGECRFLWCCCCCSEFGLQCLPDLLV